jgi:hypothetical protein
MGQMEMKCIFDIGKYSIWAKVSQVSAVAHWPLVRYARACSTYYQFLVRGSLLTNKLMSRRFQLSHLQAAFRKFYGC